MTILAPFIERHGLWTDDQKRRGDELVRRVESEGLRLIRLVWSDTHGAARAKAVSAPVFAEVLTSGYNINVATATLDGAGGRVFASFTRGGGMGLDEMTGSPNLIIVPDPASFRALPWAAGVGWVLCDQYFADGTPFHFSARNILRRQLDRLAERGLGLVIGLEVEWYLAHLLDGPIGDDNIAMPGLRGRPPATAPAEPGFSYHAESGLDAMQPTLSALAETYDLLGLPLRSVENEFGPGQVECTFIAQTAMQAADDYILFRSATRQVCRRRNMFASFMCRPALKGHYSSGWHLHQSLAALDDGRNMFMPETAGEILSGQGRAYLAGLLAQAMPATVFSTPTVNGYRRFQPNSLAPDRVSWGYDHRGGMIRVLGGAGDAATRLENRSGEPAANPYLYIAAQIIAGLDGIDEGRTPPPPDDAPYEADRPMLPASLAEACAALDADDLFRRQLGATFVDYFVALKRAEIARFEAYCHQHGHAVDGDDVTEWEHNEYYDFF
jgi:glutamine synthetase